MPTVTRCVSCARALQVPDDLLGQMVQCPSCGATFTATAVGGGPPPTAATPAPTGGAPPPRAPAAPPHVRFDDEGLDNDEDLGRGRSRPVDSEARSAVAGPAIALMVVGVLSIVVALFQGVLLLNGLAHPPRGAAARKSDPAYDAGYMVGAVSAVPLGILSGVVILTGAIRMLNLRGYSHAMTATVVAMIVPCNLCCVLGLPFGIWALVVLNRPEVKEAFDRPAWG